VITISFLEDNELPEEVVDSSLDTLPTKRMDKVFTAFDKPISSVHYGKKGSGKSLTCYAANKGNAIFVILDFNNTAKKTINAKISKDKHSNYHIFNIRKKMTFNEKANINIISAKGAKVYDYVEGLLLNEIRKISPNFIIFDGLKRCIKVVELKMRYTNMPGESAFKKFANLSLWNERNFYMDTLYDLAMDIAKDGVFFTVQEYEKPPIEMKDKKTGETKIIDRGEPTWLSSVKEDTEIVVKHEIISNFGTGEVDYIAIVESDKITGKSGSRTLTDKAYEFWEWLIDEKSIEPMF